MRYLYNHFLAHGVSMAGEPGVVDLPRASSHVAPLKAGCARPGAGPLASLANVAVRIDLAFQAFSRRCRLAKTIQAIRVSVAMGGMTR